MLIGQQGETLPALPAAQPCRNATALNFGEGFFWEVRGGIQPRASPPPPKSNPPRGVAPASSRARSVPRRVIGEGEFALEREAREGGCPGCLALPRPGAEVAPEGAPEGTATARA